MSSGYGASPGGVSTGAAKGAGWPPPPPGTGDGDGGSVGENEGGGRSGDPPPGTGDGDGGGGGENEGADSSGHGGEGDLGQRRDRGDLGKEVHNSNHLRKSKMPTSSVPDRSATSSKSSMRQNLGPKQGSAQKQQHSGRQLLSQKASHTKVAKPVLEQQHPKQPKMQPQSHPEQHALLGENAADKALIRSKVKAKLRSSLHMDNHKVGSAPINAYERATPPEEPYTYKGFYDDEDWVDYDMQPSWNKKEFWKYVPPPEIPRELEPEIVTPRADRANEINTAAEALRDRETRPPEKPAQETGPDEPYIHGNDAMSVPDDDRCEPMPKVGENSCGTLCPDGEPGDRRRRWVQRRRRTIGRIIGQHTIRSTFPANIPRTRFIEIPFDPPTIQQIIMNSHERCIKTKKIAAKDFSGDNDPPTDPNIETECWNQQAEFCVEISAGGNTARDANTTFAGDRRVVPSHPGICTATTGDMKWTEEYLDRQERREKIRDSDLKSLPSRKRDLGESQDPPDQESQDPPDQKSQDPFDKAEAPAAADSNAPASAEAPTAPASKTMINFRYAQDQCITHNFPHDAVVPEVVLKQERCTDTISPRSNEWTLTNCNIKPASHSDFCLDVLDVVGAEEFLGEAASDTNTSLGDGQTPVHGTVFVGANLTITRCAAGKAGQSWIHNGPNIRLARDPRYCVGFNETTLLVDLEFCKPDDANFSPQSFTFKKASPSSMETLEEAGCNGNSCSPTLLLSVHGGRRRRQCPPEIAFKPVDEHSIFSSPVYKVPMHPLDMQQCLRDELDKEAERGGLPFDTVESVPEKLQENRWKELNSKKLLHEQIQLQLTNEHSTKSGQAMAAEGTEADEKKIQRIEKAKKEEAKHQVDTLTSEHEDTEKKLIEAKVRVLKRYNETVTPVEEAHEKSYWANREKSAKEKIHKTREERSLSTEVALLQESAGTGASDTPPGCTWVCDEDPEPPKAGRKTEEKLTQQIQQEKQDINRIEEIEEKSKMLTEQTDVKVETNYEEKERELDRKNKLRVARKDIAFQESKIKTMRTKLQPVTSDDPNEVYDTHMKHKIQVAFQKGFMESKEKRREDYQNAKQEIRGKKQEGWSKAAEVDIKHVKNKERKVKESEQKMEEQKEKKLIAWKITETAKAENAQALSSVQKEFVDIVGDAEKPSNADDNHATQREMSIKRHGREKGYKIEAQRRAILRAKEGRLKVTEQKVMHKKVEALGGITGQRFKDEKDAKSEETDDMGMKKAWLFRKERHGKAIKEEQTKQEVKEKKDSLQEAQVKIQVVLKRKIRVKMDKAYNKAAEKHNKAVQECNELEDENMDEYALLPSSVLHFNKKTASGSFTEPTLPISWRNEYAYLKFTLPAMGAATGYPFPKISIPNENELMTSEERIERRGQIQASKDVQMATNQMRKGEEIEDQEDLGEGASRSTIPASQEEESDPPPGQDGTGDPAPPNPAEAGQDSSKEAKIDTEQIMRERTAEQEKAAAKYDGEVKTPTDNLDNQDYQKKEFTQEQANKLSKPDHSNDGTEWATPDGRQYRLAKEAYHELKGQPWNARRRGVPGEVIGANPKPDVLDSLRRRVVMPQWKVPTANREVSPKLELNKEISDKKTEAENIQNYRRRRWLARRRRRFMLDRRRRWWIRRRALRWPDTIDEKSSTYVVSRRRSERTAVKAVLRMMKMDGDESMDIIATISDCFEPTTRKGERRVEQPKTYTPELRNEELAHSAILAYDIVGQAYMKEDGQAIVDGSEPIHNMEMLPGGPQAEETFPQLPDQNITATTETIIDAERYSVQNEDMLKRIGALCCEDAAPALSNKLVELRESLNSIPENEPFDKMKKLSQIASEQKSETTQVSKCVNTWHDHGGGQWGRTHLYSNPKLSKELWEAQSRRMEQVASAALRLGESHKLYAATAVHNQVVSTMKLAGVVAQMCEEMLDERSQRRKEKYATFDTLELLQTSARNDNIGARPEHGPKRRVKRRSGLPTVEGPSATKMQHNLPWALPNNALRRAKPQGKFSGGLGEVFFAPVHKGKQRTSKTESLETTRLDARRLERRLEQPCSEYGPAYCCKNFNRFQCQIIAPDGTPDFGGPMNEPHAAWTGALAGQNADRTQIALPFRLTTDNKIEFAISDPSADSSVCDIDPKEYKGKTKICTEEEMGAGFSLGTRGFGMVSRGGIRGATMDGPNKIHPRYYKHSLDGTDPDCNNARSAIMRCSSEGERGAYIPGIAKHMADNDHAGKNPLDYTSMEAKRMMRIDAEQATLINTIPMFGSFMDAVGVEPMVEPLYNPVWQPYYRQRFNNKNFAPRHLCQCVKPYYIENNQQGCKPIRLYDGYTLAGQKCNARVVDYAEIPATYKTEYLCCDKFKEFWEGLMRIKYCDAGDGSEPQVTVEFRVRMVPLKGVIPVTFYPPARALMGSCISYVRMLALGLKYGGLPFRQELKRAATAQLEDWTYKAKKAAEFAEIEIYHDNEDEVKAKMRGRQMQWMLAKEYREDQWRERWNVNEDEYGDWLNSCCFNSIICAFMGYMLEVEFFGGKESMCLNYNLKKNVKEARKAWVQRYGLSAYEHLRPSEGFFSKINAIRC